jgi:hypothetical protein
VPPAMSIVTYGYHFISQYRPMLMSLVSTWLLLSYTEHTGLSQHGLSFWRSTICVGFQGHLWTTDACLAFGDTVTVSIDRFLSG